EFSNRERIHHPNLYNAFRPALPDRAFALSSMEALLRYGDTGSAALTSELFRLCPNNFGDASDAGARRRGLVTLRSFDVDRPGVTPWFWLDANEAVPKRYDRMKSPYLPVPPPPSPP